MSSQSADSEDFKAALIQLKQGDRKNLMKFCSFILLIAAVLGFISGLVFSIGLAAQAILSV